MTMTPYICALCQERYAETMMLGYHVCTTCHDSHDEYMAREQECVRDEQVHDEYTEVFA